MKHVNIHCRQHSQLLALIYVVITVSYKRKRERERERESDVKIGSVEADGS